MRIIETWYQTPLNIHRFNLTSQQGTRPTLVWATTLSWLERRAAFTLTHSPPHHIHWYHFYTLIWWDQTCPENLVLQLEGIGTLFNKDGFFFMNGKILCLATKVCYGNILAKRLINHFEYFMYDSYIRIACSACCRFWWTLKCTVHRI